MTSEITFKPRFGEPNWASRPFQIANATSDLTNIQPMSDTSYEENRLKAIGELNIATLTRIPRASEGEKPDHSSTWQPFLSAIAHRRKTFLRWAQSPVIEVSVGPFAEVFQLPRDFLARRSPVFRTMIKESPERTIRLHETNSHAFEHVAIWLMSPKPMLDQGLTLSTAVDIAVFATVYTMPSLLHQAIDLLHLQLKAFGCWTPPMLDHIYRHTSEDDLIREFTRATLHLIDRLTMFTDSAARVEKWKNVFKRHSGLGYEYFMMRQQDRKPADLTNGKSCQFHRHSQRLSASVEVGFGESRCQKLEEAECFEDVGGSGVKKEQSDAVDNLAASLVSLPSQLSSNYGDEDVLLTPTTETSTAARNLWDEASIDARSTGVSSRGTSRSHTPQPDSNPSVTSPTRS